MKFFGATDWIFTAVSAAIVYPAYLFTMLILVDILEWAERSSSTVPFTSVVLYLTIWFCLAVPFSVFGSYIGFK